MYKCVSSDSFKSRSLSDEEEVQRINDLKKQQIETSKRKLQYFTAIKTLFGCYTLVRQNARLMDHQETKRFDLNDVGKRKRSARANKPVVRSKSMERLLFDGPD